MGQQLIKNYNFEQRYTSMYGGICWKIFNGIKKDKNADKVSIFSFEKK